MGWKTKLLLLIVLPILASRYLDQNSIGKAKKLIKNVLRAIGIQDEEMLEAKRINKVVKSS